MATKNLAPSLPIISIAGQNFTQHALDSPPLDTTIKPVPKSPARSAQSIHPPSTPPIPARSAQRAVFTPPVERQLIALQQLRSQIPTSFYEPHERGWRFDKPPPDPQERGHGKVGRKGRYPWHKMRLCLRFAASCFILTVIALVYHRYGFWGADYFTIWAMLVVSILPVRLMP
jgi:hypothetical protein